MSVATTGWKLDDSYARQLPRLAVGWTAAPVPRPRLLVLNEGLAAELGVDPEHLRSPEGLALLLGQVPAGPATVALAYAGHQFGVYVPRLGDGRALLLGEVLDTAGRRRDVHLKGSGRTPFARGGDGRAAVGPMLREYVISEAMQALGIPTTRSLAVVATGEQVVRETTLPGAVLVRVAASHIRVGTFEYAARTGDVELLRALAEHALTRHHPQAAGSGNPYLEFYRRVVDAQAALVAHWMLVGFVHGVMNTDNMTISGETIDYGPCAFMDAYDPRTAFSSIDRTGRYAYGNQPAVAQWDLARLGETLLPLVDADLDAAVAAVTEVVNSFADSYLRYRDAGFASKLGLAAPDRALVDDLLELLHAQRVDFTNFFRALSRGSARDLFLDRDGFDAWAHRWQAAGPDRAAMDRVNPVYIPRNHRVEQALAAATAGELDPLHRLLDVITHPFEERPGLESWTEPGTGPYVTYCGT